MEIEKGRHQGKNDRNTRKCKVCNKGEVETEEHFLKSCDLYNNLKIKNDIPERSNSIAIVSDTDPIKLAKYLSDAWAERKSVLGQPQDP